jgi:hypothetical protein
VFSLNLAMKNFRFVVLPDVFAVHAYENYRSHPNIWLVPMMQKKDVYLEVEKKIIIDDNKVPKLDFYE